MTGAAATAGFAVEILVKQHEIAPVRIIRVPRHIAMTWACAILVRQKDTPQPAGKFARYFLKRHHVSGPGRAFDFERVAIKEVITFERFDDQEIDREPDRTAPVRVAAEKVAVPLTRNVIDPVFFVACAEDVRFFAVNPGNRAKSVWR